MKSKTFVSSFKSVDWLIWLGDNKNDTCYFIGGYHGTFIIATFIVMNVDEVTTINNI
jgi:hypothetical protein